MPALCVRNRGEGVIFALIKRGISGDTLGGSQSDLNFRPLPGVLSHVGAQAPDSSPPVFAFEAHAGIGATPLLLPVTYPPKNQ
jgi:hypothetical protein